MGWLNKLFGGSTRRVSVNNPLVIASPTIGFLNLLGEAGGTLLEADRAAFGDLFASFTISESDAPECDVLMVYAQLMDDGSIAGTTAGYREIICRARARIVIFASDNEPRAYIAAGKQPTNYRGSANIVMTTDRRGEVFQRFFFDLFSMMFHGKTMLMAWVKLAPQIPRTVHDNCPDTILLPEVSHIVFR